MPDKKEPKRRRRTQVPAPPPPSLWPPRCIPIPAHESYTLGLWNGAIHSEHDVPGQLYQRQGGYAVVAGTMLHRAYSRAEEPARSMAGIVKSVPLDATRWVVVFSDKFSVILEFSGGSSEVVSAFVTNMLQDGALFVALGKDRNNLIKGNELMAILRGDSLDRTKLDSASKADTPLVTAAAFRQNALEQFQGGAGI